MNSDRSILPTELSSTFCRYEIGMKLHDQQIRDKYETDRRDLGQDFSLPDLHPGPFSIADRIRSFKHAIDGIILMLRSQHNAWLHAVASVTVLVSGALCHLSAADYCWLVIAIVAVWTAEALNTALEFLADVASPEFHPLAKKAKDVAAGAVLISAAGSVVIALLIFGPHLYKCLSMLR